MGLPEDLQSLQDLHTKGKLTDQEFADAKATTLRKYQGAPAEDRSSDDSSLFSLRPGFGVLLVIILAFLAWVWYNAGTKQTKQMIASAVHAPITLKDETQNLPASSWKAVGLNLPYSGTLDVNVEIVRGNPIDVFLTTTDQLDNMNKAQWNQVRAYSEFNATKTKAYRRSARLGQGVYYLVLRDTSLGILSMSASDVAVKVQLNP